MPTRSNDAECTPVSTIRVTGAKLEFKGLSVAQYKAEPEVEPKLKHAIAAAPAATVPPAASVTATAAHESGHGVGLPFSALHLGFGLAKGFVYGF